MSEPRRPDRSAPTDVRDLFPALSAEGVAALADYPRLIQRVQPLPSRHRAALPRAVRDLWRTLASERDHAFDSGYMSHPASMAAYLRYFHPWNLFRLTRLFSALPLELPAGATVLDLGSGPLTAVQALWLARPELRSRSLTVHCLDRAAAPLKVGLKLFAALAGEDCPWSVRIRQAGLTTRLPGRAQLVVAANALNEVPGRRGDPGLERVVRALEQASTPDGTILVVEPGSRAGGRLVAGLRAELLEEGFLPVAPCPHGAECPMPGVSGRPWCHFGFGVSAAPDWLHHLAREAGLPKTRASLSFVMLSRRATPPGGTAVRVVSDAFELPGHGFARYGCAEAGLVLLSGTRERLAPLTPGLLLHPKWPDTPRRDTKSGGLLVPLADVTRKIPSKVRPSAQVPVAKRPKAVRGKGGPTKQRTGSKKTQPGRAGKLHRKPPKGGG